MGKGLALMRDKRLWWGAATVVVLAVVILVVAAVSAPKRTAAPSVQPIPSVVAESLGQQAQTALSNGETSTAVALAQRALAQDPKNSVAMTVIERSKTSAPPASSQTDNESEGEPAPSAGPPAGIYANPVADMTTLLPVSVKGWSPGTVVFQETEALVTFEPNQATPASKSTVRALLIAHDRGSAAKASAFLTKVDKRVYSKDRATVDVGATDAYFGTDGTRLAVVAFARGRFAFEVILTAQPKVNPSSLKSIGIDMAKTLPAAN